MQKINRKLNYVKPKPIIITIKKYSANKLKMVEKQKLHTHITGKKIIFLYFMLNFHLNIYGLMENKSNINFINLILLKLKNANFEDLTFYQVKCKWSAYSMDEW